jgi:TBC1 domain family protein 5
MHELLAVCLLAVDRDSIQSEAMRPAQSMVSPLGSPKIDQPEMDQAMFATLDRRFVEHDAFELFCAVMKGAKASYEWRAEEGPVR